MDNNSFALGFLLAFIIFEIPSLFYPIRDFAHMVHVKIEESFVSSRFFVSHQTLLFKVLFHWSDFLR